MKKLLYILCAAALAAGCSDDDASSYYLDVHDLAYHHFADAGIQRDELFHFKAAGEQLLLQLLCGDIDINEFF